MKADTYLLVFKAVEQLTIYMKADTYLLVFKAVEQPTGKQTPISWFLRL